MERVGQRTLPFNGGLLLDGCQLGRRNMACGIRRRNVVLPLPEVRVKRAILPKPQATIEVEAHWRRLQGADAIAPCTSLQQWSHRQGTPDPLSPNLWKGCYIVDACHTPT